MDVAVPTIPFKAYAYNEIRYTSLTQARPDDAAALLIEAQAAVTDKYRQYEALAFRDDSRFALAGGASESALQP